MIISWIINAAEFFETGPAASGRLFKRSPRFADQRTCRDLPVVDDGDAFTVARSVKLQSISGEQIVSRQRGGKDPRPHASRKRMPRSPANAPIEPAARHDRQNDVGQLIGP